MSKGKGILVAFTVYTLVALLKFAAYFSTGYLSMLAEASHTALDALIAIALYIVLRISQRPPDREHPYGHHRFESLVAITMAIVFVIGIGWSMFRQGFFRILGSEHPAYASPAFPFAVLIVAFFLNFLPLAILKREQNMIARTMFLEMINDQLDTIAAFLGIGGASLGYAQLDGVGTVLISLFIFRTGYILFTQNAKVLVGTSPQPDFYDKVRQVVLAVPGVENAHDMMAEYIGPDLLRVDLHITVDKNMTVADAETIMDTVNVKLREKIPTVRFATVDVCPHKGEQRATADSVFQGMREQITPPP